MSNVDQAAGQDSLKGAPRPPAQSAGQERDALPLIICIGWGMGTFGISSMFNSVNLLLQRFATDFLGIAAAAYGLIYLVSKIYDAATDPVMGVLSDRRAPNARRMPISLRRRATACAVTLASPIEASARPNRPRPPN